MTIGRAPGRLRFARPSVRHDPVGAFVPDLLRHQRQCQLPAHHACEEAAHGMLLPSRHFHDGRDRHPLRAAQQCDHVGLLGAGAHDGVAGCLSGLARFRRPGGWLVREFGRLVPDRLKPPLGDAQGVRNVPVAAPHRQRTAGLDFFDQALGKELGHHLAGRAAGQIRRPFKGTVVVLRSGRQQHQLSIGEFHGILHSVATAIGAATTEAPQWLGGRRGRIPQGLFAEVPTFPRVRGKGPGLSPRILEELNGKPRISRRVSAR
jgi:hypothetical protein